MPGNTTTLGTDTQLSGIVIQESAARTTVNADGTVTVNSYGTPGGNGTVEDGNTGSLQDVVSYEFFALPAGLQIPQQGNRLAPVDPTMVGSFIGYRVHLADGTLGNNGNAFFGQIIALGNNGFVLATGNNTSNLTTILNVNPTNIDLIVSTLNLDYYNPATGDPYRPDPANPLNGLPVAPFTIGGPITCFASGTRIATPGGTVRVEDLNAGDRITTASGDVRLVQWVGSRTIDCARQPDPSTAWPVRIAAGAFGPGLPIRDLFLSRDHGVFVDGALIPAGRLVNGRSIIASAVARVTYHHVELELHDVLLAEGLPCESYLDIGARRLGFEGGNVVTTSLDLTVRTHEAEGCAPLVVTGPLLETVRARLAFIADELAASTAAFERAA